MFTPEAARHVHAGGARADQGHDARPAPRLAQGPDPENHGHVADTERQAFKSDLQARWDALPAARKTRIEQRLAGAASKPAPQPRALNESARLSPAPKWRGVSFLLGDSMTCRTCHDLECRRHHPDGVCSDLHHGRWWAARAASTSIWPPAMTGHPECRARLPRPGQHGRAGGDLPAAAVGGDALFPWLDSRRRWAWSGASAGCSTPSATCKEANKRGPGFGIAALATLALLVLSIWGVVVSWMAVDALT